jgi:hypothetical protein
MKFEFSKKLLILDYLILMVLFLCAVIFPEVDIVTVIVAWIAQVGISSAAYYWKAKNENRAKVPLKVIESLPDEMREQIDLTQIITSIIQSN